MTTSNQTTSFDSTKCPDVASQPTRPPILPSPSGLPLPLPDAHTVFLFDLDQTLLYGTEAVPGAVAMVAWVRARGHTLRVVTNNNRYAPWTIARRLHAAGMPVQESEIVSPLTRAAPLGACFLWGTSEAERYLQSRGVVTDDTSAPVLLCYRENYTHDDLAECCARAAQHGFVLGNTDAVYPDPERLRPDTGCVAAYVSRCIGCAPTRSLDKATLRPEHLPGVPDLERALFVGDRPQTDGACATNLGVDFYHLDGEGRTMATLLERERSIPSQRRGPCRSSLSAVPRTTPSPRPRVEGRNRVLGLTPSHAYVTLVTNDFYAKGGVALAHSLVHSGTYAPLIVMCLPSVSNEARATLRGIQGCWLWDVALPDLTPDFVARHSPTNMGQHAPYKSTAEYGAQKPTAFWHLHNFAKLRLWQLTPLERVVFLDADTIVLRNIDSLFHTTEPFMAACDLNCSNLDKLVALNSGVFVTTPSATTYDTMVERLRTDDRLWRRTDQSFLESWFPDWNHLSCSYNTVQYAFLVAPFDVSRTRVLHFAMQKPWETREVLLTKATRRALRPLHDLWWRMYRGEDLEFVFGDHGAVNTEDEDSETP